MAFRYKLYKVPAFLYFFISIVALLGLFMSGKNMELAGVGIVILTLPWSIIEIAVLDSMHIDNFNINILLTVVDVVLNTILLLFTCRLVARKLKTSEQRYYEVMRKEVANQGDAPDQKSVR